MPANTGQVHGGDGRASQAGASPAVRAVVPVPAEGPHPPKIVRFRFRIGIMECMEFFLHGLTFVSCSRFRGLSHALAGGEHVRSAADTDAAHLQEHRPQEAAAVVQRRG